MINNILTYLNISWVGAILTIITFIIALIVGYFFYSKGKPNKNLKTHSENFLIIDRSKADSPEQIEILFLGNKIESLYKTLIYFWNDGNQIIKADDLKTIDRLKISTNENAKILSVEIVKCTRDVINFYLAKDGEDYQVNFDYLDPTDGVLIEVLHTGNSENLFFSGTVMGILNKIDISNKQNKTEILFKSISFILNPTSILEKTKTGTKAFGYIATSIGTLVISIGTYVLLNPTKLIEKPQIEPSWSIIFVGLLYFIIGVFFVVYSQNPYPKNLMPNKSNRNE